MSPVVPSRGALSPLGVADVRIGPGFWGDRQRLNGDVILDHCRGWMERLGWVDNFRAAAQGRLPADRAGREFSDADVYKLVEAMCWEAARTGRHELDGVVGELGGVIACAQEPDGYLNTMFASSGTGGRYRDLEWGHELYCYGHLIQAGVARLRSVTCSVVRSHDGTGHRTGGGAADDDAVVAVARRAADHVCTEFGPDGRQAVDGHPVIEMALVELYRATGQERYLEQARLFVERRGRPALAEVEYGRAYFQDDVPVRAARVLRGHAVRALYLACGAVDVAVETGDGELLAAIADQWAHTIACRTYLTGGMGSRHDDEAFGDDYELPPDRAYAETCAGVASVMLAWRLLLATGEARYADVAERTLFNVVATAVARDGRAFFYSNPLHVRVPPAVPDPSVESPRAQSGLRAPWFTTACCPPNVARMLASLSAYVATTDRSGVQIHQLMPAAITAPLADGGLVHLRVDTDYPWSGRVTVHVDDTPDRAWRLAVRAPAWAGNLDEVTGSVYGGSTDQEISRTQNGYVAVERQWRPGDRLRVELPVRPRWTYADPRIDATRGAVAVERGPLVYCAESSTDRLDLVEVDDTSDPVDLRPEPALDGAVTVGVPTRDLPAPEDSDWAYLTVPPRAEAGALRTRTLVPYCLWGNSGPVAMRVWLPALTGRPGPR